MTKTEKEQVFALLTTAQNYIRGFSDDTCETPVFFDNKIENTKDGKSQKMTLELLSEKVLSCTRCNLSKNRTHVVFGQGVSLPLVLVVGEGPGEDEDRQGLPFVGKSGQLLDKMLAAINLSRTTNCYIANIVKCRPPANRDPFPEECNSCKSYLDAQIHLLKPKMILCVGRIAAQNLFKCQETVSAMRGKMFDVNGIPAMMTYHPSALLRNENLKRPAWEDLKLFRKYLDEHITNLALK